MKLISSFLEEGVFIVSKDNNRYLLILQSIWFACEDAFILLIIIVILSGTTRKVREGWKKGQKVFQIHNVPYLMIPYLLKGIVIFNEESNDKPFKITFCKYF